MISIFGFLDSVKITHLSLLVLATEEKLLKRETLDILDENDYHVKLSLFNVAYAGDALDCFGRATGISTITRAVQTGIMSLGRAGVLKLAKIVLSRTAGYIGAAVMMYDFSKCMGWLDEEEVKPYNVIIQPLGNNNDYKIETK